MSDKSHVTMEQRVCEICGKPYDRSILLDTRLRKRFDNMHTVTGMGLCPEDKAKMDEGYLALVEVDESKSKFEANGTLKPENAYRTGTMVHIRRTVAKKLFNVPVPDDLPAMFTNAEVIAKIVAMMPEKDKS